MNDFQLTVVGVRGESGEHAARLVAAVQASAPGHVTTLHLLMVAANATEEMMYLKPATKIHVLVRLIGDLYFSAAL